jgi:outer membrane protein TolC
VRSCRSPVSQFLPASPDAAQATRFINILEAGYADKLEKDREGNRAIKRGFEVDFQIPIFDFGEVRVRQAEAVYMQAVNRLLELAVNVRSQARDAYRVYRSAYDIAGHYQHEREALIRLLGLWDGELKFKLPNVLPALPRRAQSLAAIEVEAVRRRVDLQIARMELDALARGYGLTLLPPSPPRPTSVRCRRPAGRDC